MTRKESIWMLVTAMGAGLAGGVLSGLLIRGEPVIAQETAPSGRVLIAEEFRLVSRNGKVRAGLSAQADGTASLTFYDGAGQVRAEMGINAAGVSELGLYDQTGKQRKPEGFAYLFVLPNGGPRLNLVGDAANLTVASPQLASHVTLKVEPDHTPTVNLEGAGKGSALLTMLHDGNPSFVLYDPEGYRRAMLEVSEMGAKGKGVPRSALMLLDKNEKLVWSAP
jgi:hypothetical protein